MRNEKFGRFLKGAIGSIAVHEGKTAPVIEEELGDLLGVTAASIQRYKAGHIPPNLQAIEILAASAIKRGYLNRDWLLQFLQAAHYPKPQPLIERLYPQPASTQITAAYNNLAAPGYNQFVMRAEQYAQVVEGLQQRSAATLIVSLGGMGKTSLAREIAGDCANGKLTTRGGPFVGIVWLSDNKQAGAITLETVLNEIALVMDYPVLLQAPLKSRQREVETILRRQPVLLVIDNYETITDEGLGDWLINLPEPSKVLITGREIPNRLQHRAWLVQLGGLNKIEATEFIENKIRGLKIGQLVPASTFERLLAITGGNPKAIELVLGWLKHGKQAFEEVLTDLQLAQFDFFGELFERGWQSLQNYPASQQILLLTTLFAGSAPAPALPVISQLEKSKFRAALTHLTDLGWLDVQEARYSLHPLVSAFVKNKLASLPNNYTDVIKSARERQLDWYIQLTAQVGYCWDDLTKLELLDAELETITGLLKWCVIEQKYSQLLELTKNIDYYYYIRGLWSVEPNISYLRLLAARQTEYFEEEVLALSYYSQMLCRCNQLAEALVQLTQLENMLVGKAEQLPDNIWFEVQYSFGIYFMVGLNYARAIPVWRNSLERAAKLSVRNYAVSRGWLATCLYRQGNLNEAAELWQAVLQDSTVHNFSRGVVSSRLGLARICLDNSRLQEAENHLAQAATLARQGEERKILAEILTLYGRYYEAVGQPASAQKYFAEATDILNRLGKIVL